MPVAPGAEAGSLRTTVVLCTRDRPADLHRCISSILAHRPDGCALVVVDQSTSPLSPPPDVAGVVVLPCARTGLSVARNLGMRAAADADLLLFTDDDCEIRPGWVEAWQRAFAASPSAGVGFGLVRPGPFDPSAGLIPHFDPGPTRHSWGAELFRLGADRVGMGANMAVRVRAARAAGDFDELLGAGSVFPAAEDLDMAFRIVRRGWSLLHDQAPEVVHYGYRPRRDASELARGYAGATAAMLLKQARCGDRLAARLVVGETVHLARRVACSLRSGARPLGLVSLVAFTRGLLASAVQPLDPAGGVYRRRSR